MSSLHSDALLAAMLFEKRQGEAIEPSEVLAQMDIPNARLIFAISHVEAPVAGVFDCPVTAHSAGKPFHAHRKTADVITCLAGLFAIAKTEAVTTPIDFNPFHRSKPGRLFGAGIWM